MELIRKTIGECVNERAHLSGKQTALEMCGWSCTFEQMDRYSDFLAVRMGTRGIKKGTHVGIWSLNSPNWVITFLALTKIGAVPVLINTCFVDDEVVRTLNYADVEVLYYGTGYKAVGYGDLLERVREQIPRVRQFIPIGGTEDETWGRKDDLIRTTCSPEALRELEAQKRAVGPDDPACMIFTSGTTSFAKGVMLSHYSLVNNARAMVQAMHWGEGDRMCLAVPMFHCFGVTAGILACTLGGAEMDVLPCFKTVHVWDTLERRRCTILNGVPSMFLALIRKPEFRGRRADTLVSGIIAGSPVTPEEYAEICGRFPGLHLQPSYGQTETSPCVSIADWDEPKREKGASAGRVVDHVRVRIADPGTGEIRERGRDGEIQVQGYNVMLGYYKLPEVTAGAFTEDGWLKTGDMGRLDGSGKLHVTGRIKEMIIRGGENISPEEIEQVIKKLDWVDQVKVVGIPAEVLQEEIAACIVPKPGREVRKDELLDFLRPRLAHFKVPAYILPFDSFPTNASGKIVLKDLKRKAKAMAEAERSAPKDGGPAACGPEARAGLQGRGCCCSSQKRN